MGPSHKHRGMAAQGVCFPGDVVDDSKQAYLLGYGVYRDDYGSIRSSLLGTCERREKDGTTELSVTTSSTHGQAIESVITIGDIVHAQVRKIGMNQAQVEIFALGDVVLTNFARGVIRREDMKLKEIDSLVVRDCFRPEDIVRAQVISLGDSRQYYLSTAEDELGVIHAKSEVDNSLLQASSQSEMLNVKTNIKELRKVAMI